MANLRVLSRRECMRLPEREREGGEGGRERGREGGRGRVIKGQEILWTSTLQTHDSNVQL